MSKLLCCVLLALLSFCKALGMPDGEVVCLYEEWTEPIETIETEDQLFEMLPKNGDEFGLTDNNILFHLYKDSCSEGLSNPVFVGAHYQTGPSVLHLAAMNYEKVYPQIFNDWNLPSNCSLFIWIPIHSKYNENFAEFSILQDSSLPSFSSFINTNRKTKAFFVNKYGKNIKFYWYEKNPRSLGEMTNDQRRTEHTFLGHIFKASDADDDSFIDLYLIDGHENKIISRDAMHEWCSEKNFIQNSKECIDEYEFEMVDWAYKFWARKREALNYAQPKIVPNFTAIGFAKTRLPDEVFQPVWNFWQRKKATEQFTGENYAGPVLNQYTSPTHMAHLQQKERQILIDYFRVALANWAGFDDPNMLEMTSLYGIRQYSRDAVLAMHVDTCKTHVISAIVNVDSKLDEGKDWPLQIYDHFGQLHEISMRPQDVVFYESAKCGHSRRKALPGDYYANLFIHYKPSGHWDFDWF